MLIHTLSCRHVVFLSCWCHVVPSPDRTDGLVLCCRLTPAWWPREESRTPRRWAWRTWASRPTVDSSRRVLWHHNRAKRWSRSRLDPLQVSVAVSWFRFLHCGEVGHQCLVCFFFVLVFVHNFEVLCLQNHLLHNLTGDCSVPREDMRSIQCGFIRPPLFTAGCHSKLPPSSRPMRSVSSISQGVPMHGHWSDSSSSGLLGWLCECVALMLMLMEMCCCCSCC